MNRSEFQEGMQRDYEAILAINNAKGHDYAGDDDALSNFYEQAADSGVTPFKVWSIFFGKHRSAIQTFIREGSVQSEPIEGRIHDAILYLFLLLALVREDRRMAQGPPTRLPAGGGI